MNYKDTLTLYDELILAGTPEPQARAQAHQLGAWNDILGKAINDFTSEIHKINIRLEKIDKDMSWIRYIGAAMTVAFFSNIIVTVWLG